MFPWSSHNLILYRFGEIFPIPLVENCNLDQRGHLNRYVLQRISVPLLLTGQGQGKASASELPYGGYMLLWQPHLSTAEAACESAVAKRSRKRLARGAGGRLLQAGTQRRTEEKTCIIVKCNNN